MKALSQFFNGYTVLHGKGMGAVCSFLVAGIVAGLPVNMAFANTEERCYVLTYKNERVANPTSKDVVFDGYDCGVLRERQYSSFSEALELAQKAGLSVDDDSLDVLKPLLEQTGHFEFYTVDQKIVIQNALNSGGNPLDYDILSENAQGHIDGIVKR